MRFVSEAPVTSGSYEVRAELERLVAQRGLEGRVRIGVAFCLGGCRSGVSVRFGDRVVTGVTVDNVAAVLDAHLEGC